SRHTDGSHATRGLPLASRELAQLLGRCGAERSGLRRVIGRVLAEEESGPIACDRGLAGGGPRPERQRSSLHVRSRAEPSACLDAPLIFHVRIGPNVARFTAPI